MFSSMLPPQGQAAVATRVRSIEVCLSTIALPIFIASGQMKKGALGALGAQGGE
ncbi:MAG: hypothetical protein NVSMB44_33010 [Ktedonobacteraceae bacterium]